MYLQTQAVSEEADEQNKQLTGVPISRSMNTLMVHWNPSPPPAKPWRLCD